ncbi:hypothetical protein ACVWXO_001001 [Bradyrhizobium sp. LM2.7]
MEITVSFPSGGWKSKPLNRLNVAHETVTSLIDVARSQWLAGSGDDWAVLASRSARHRDKHLGICKL